MTAAAMRETDPVAVDELRRALVVQAREVADGPVTVLAGASGNGGGASMGAAARQGRATYPRSE